jgi:hypothetical protein
MSIKFLMDENIPYAIIDLLEKRGFSVDQLKRIVKTGIKNGEVGTSCKKVRTDGSHVGHSTTVHLSEVGDRC